jgi:hypothetical protein
MISLEELVANRLPATRAISANAMIGTRKIIITGSLILGLGSTFATNGFGQDTDLTGADLDKICGNRDSHSDLNLLCYTYMHGFLDGLNIGAALPRMRLSYCPPKNLTIIQGRLIVEKYLRDHPTELELDAGIIATRALLAAYPCPRGTDSN